MALVAGLAVAGEFSVQAGGAEIATEPGGPVWSRCAVGAHWTGRACAGLPARLDRADALRAAADAARQSGQPWRLPRLAELKAWEQHCERALGDDLRLCEQWPMGWYWSASARVTDVRLNPYDYRNIQRGLTNATLNRVAFLHGLALHSPSGAASEALKSERLYVRLVRSPATTAASAPER